MERNKIQRSSVSFLVLTALLDFSPLHMYLCVCLRIYVSTLINKISHTELLRLCVSRTTAFTFLNSFQTLFRQFPRRHFPDRHIFMISALDTRAKVLVVSWNLSQITRLDVRGEPRGSLGTPLGEGWNVNFERVRKRDKKQPNNRIKLSRGYVLIRLIVTVVRDRRMRANWRIGHLPTNDAKHALS